MAARCLSFALLLCVCGVATATEVESRVEAVTLYPSGALVTRLGTISLAAGETAIRLTGLVDSIEREYVQVEISDASVRIGQVQLSTEQQRDAISSEVESLQSQIEDINGQIRAVDDSSGAANLRLKFLDSLAQGYASDGLRGDNQGTPSIGTLRAALELMQTESEDARALIRDNDGRKRELQKDLSVLQRTLRDLQGNSLQTTTAEVTVNAQRATAAEIRIRYFQEDAYWTPLYEARLDSNSGELELAQQALVVQETDEEWDNVMLTLSTSEPSGELIAPSVNSEFLDIREPAPPAARRALQSAAPESFEEIVVTGSRLNRRQVETGNFAVNYRIPGLSSVPNDSDDGVSLDLQRFSFATELVTQVVPRESTQAFLAARFTYDRNTPLYGSEMRVFVDGAFAGLSEMPTALPLAEVVLPMGQDRRVEVKAETQGGEGGTSGIIGRRKTEVTDYVFEITNRRDKPSLVEVLDRIPVARNRDIDVEVPRTATPPDERDMDDRPGLFLWRNSVGAGESWQIRHQYTVTYPQRFILIRDN